MSYPIRENLWIMKKWCLRKNVTLFFKGSFFLRVQDEQVTFNVFEAMKFPSNVDVCFTISVLDRVAAKKFHESFPSSPLENCIVNGKTLWTLDDEGIIECVNNLDALPIYECPKRLNFKELGVFNVNNISSKKEPPKLELKQLHRILGMLS